MSFVGRLVELFTEALRLQSAARLHKLNSGEPTAPIRVPFWAWASNLDHVRDILRPIGEDENQKWVYYVCPIIEWVFTRPDILRFVGLDY